MAKGRIKVGGHVVRWMAKDTDFYKAMYHCGSLTDRHLDALNIKPGRCGDHIADRLVTSDTDKKTGETVYHLTKAGFEKCAELGFNRAMKYDAQGTSQHAYHHDLKLADKYFEARMEDESHVQNWVNEAEIRNMITEAIYDIKETDPVRFDELIQMHNEKKFSACDGGYWKRDEETGEQKLVLVEVITPSYGSDKVSAKMETAMLLNAQYDAVFAR